MGDDNKTYVKAYTWWGMLLVGIVIWYTIFRVLGAIINSIL